MTSPRMIRQPSETQFRSVAQQVIEMKRRLSSVAVPTGEESAAADSITNLVSPTPSTASASEAKIVRLASDLKSSYDEIQSVRRDVGVLRQVYTDFRTETSGVLGSLREQTNHVKNLANAQVSGSRAFIDTGKAKLDSRSQELLTKVEELQDAIDDLKNDVTARRIKPKPKQMDAIKSSISTRQTELEELTKYIATVKPMWKKTWEAELQNIVEEQQLLNHQEELLSDLKADQENVVAIFEQIQKYLSLRQATPARKPEYRPPSPEHSHEGIKTVMLEVRGLNADPDKRMRAIEQAEKARQREVANQTDEFASELGSFVDGRMLRKTGTLQLLSKFLTFANSALMLQVEPRKLSEYDR